MRAAFRVLSTLVCGDELNKLWCIEYDISKKRSGHSLKTE